VMKKPNLLSNVNPYEHSHLWLSNTIQYTELPHHVWHNYMSKRIHLAQQL
jgi:hypothetical protein